MDEKHKYHVAMAKYAEHCERYDDMAKEMKKLVESLENGQRLSDEERNLLSVAYKNIVGTRRNAWRTIDGLNPRTDKDDKLPVEVKERLCQEFKIKLQKELEEICTEVICLLDKYLLVDPDSAESHVFYQKMKGDYLRYQVEVASVEGRKDLTEKSKVAYDAAWEKAKESLKANHPIRLGLALNFSVFYYEIANETTKACKLAQEAFQDGLDIQTNGQRENDDNQKDSTLILQLLRDNLELWTHNRFDDEEQEGYQQEEN